MSTGVLNLVADIGGTNARFALVENDNFHLMEARSLICADYPGIVEAIEDYLDKVKIGQPERAVISIASPVLGDRVCMTNHAWRFSVDETRRELGWKAIQVINDFTALALALPHIPESECLKIGGGEIEAGHTKAVIGPGTGLGVSGLAPCGERWVPLEGEGGHVSYGPLTEREQAIIQIIRQRKDHVSAETLVCGRGISLLYEVLTGLDKADAKILKPGEITDLAVKKHCPQAVEALNIFCEVLGTISGNLALTLGARGGVYLGGGILPKIVPFLLASNFRQRFEQHGRFTEYLRRIPTSLIQIEYPALIGAVAALNGEYSTSGYVSTAG